MGPPQTLVYKESGNVAWTCRLLNFESEFQKYFIIIFMVDCVYTDFPKLYSSQKYGIAPSYFKFVPLVD